MQRLPKRHLWEWFQRYNKEFLTLHAKPRKEAVYWLNELNVHLMAYCKYLSYSLVWEKKGPVTLFITVNGRAKYFKRVDTLVALAPAIPGWIITALEQPRPIDFLLEREMEAAGADPEELCFSFDHDDPASGCITVYHPLCTAENEVDFRELACAAIYNLLGERSYGTNIRHLDVTNRSLADSDNLRSLEELPALISCGNSPLMVDNYGNLIDKHNL